MLIKMCRKRRVRFPRKREKHGMTRQVPSEASAHFEPHITMTVYLYTVVLVGMIICCILQNHKTNCDYAWNTVGRVREDTTRVKYPGLCSHQGVPTVTESCPMECPPAHRACWKFRLVWVCTALYSRDVNSCAKLEEYVYNIYAYFCHNRDRITWADGRLGIICGYTGHINSSDPHREIHIWFYIYINYLPKVGFMDESYEIIDMNTCIMTSIWPYIYNRYDIRKRREYIPRDVFDVITVIDDLIYMYIDGQYFYILQQGKLKSTEGRPDARILRHNPHRGSPWTSRSITQHTSSVLLYSNVSVQRSKVDRMSCHEVECGCPPCTIKISFYLPYIVMLECYMCTQYDFNEVQGPHTVYSTNIVLHIEFRLICISQVMPIQLTKWYEVFNMYNPNELCIGIYVCYLTTQYVYNEVLGPSIMYSTNDLFYIEFVLICLCRSHVTCILRTEWHAAANMYNSDICSLLTEVCIFNNFVFDFLQSLVKCDQAVNRVEPYLVLNGGHDERLMVDVRHCDILVWLPADAWRHPCVANPKLHPAPRDPYRAGTVSLSLPDCRILLLDRMLYILRLYKIDTIKCVVMKDQAYSCSKLCTIIIDDFYTESRFPVFRILHLDRIFHMIRLYKICDTIKYIVMRNRTNSCSKLCVIILGAIHTESRLPDSYTHNVSPARCELLYIYCIVSIHTYDLLDNYVLAVQHKILNTYLIFSIYTRIRITNCASDPQCTQHKTEHLHRIATWKPWTRDLVQTSMRTFIASKASRVPNRRRMYEQYDRTNVLYENIIYIRCGGARVCVHEGSMLVCIKWYFNLNNNDKLCFALSCSFCVRFIYICQIMMMSRGYTVVYCILWNTWIQHTPILKF